VVAGSSQQRTTATLVSPKAPALFLEMSFSAPCLYLANGVTTMRTTGSVDAYTDLELKHGR